MADINAIKNKIWDMANQLRGTMDAAEYRDYILGFMFYRYLSERQEEWLVEEEVIEVSEAQTANEVYREDASGEDLPDYLKSIANSLGYAISPKYTWASIIEKVYNNKIISSDYPDMFKDFGGL